MRIPTPMKITTENQASTAPRFGYREFGLTRPFDTLSAAAAVALSVIFGLAVSQPANAQTSSRSCPGGRTSDAGACTVAMMTCTFDKRYMAGVTSHQWTRQE